MAIFLWVCGILLCIAVLHRVTGERFPMHITDITPDYPGGLAGFLFVVAVVLITVGTLLKSQ